MILKTILLCFVTTTLSFPTQENEKPKLENYAENLENLRETYVIYEKDFLKDLAGFEISFLRDVALTRNEVYLEDRDETFRMFKSDVQQIINQYKSILKEDKKINDKPLNDTLLVEKRIDLLGLKVIEQNLQMTKVIYQISDPQVIKMIPSTKNPEQLELEKSSKEFIENHLQESEIENKNVNEFGTEIQHRIENFLSKKLENEISDLTKSLKSRLDKILFDSKVLYERKRQMIISKSGPVSIRNLFIFLANARVAHIPENENLTFEYFQEKLDSIQQQILQLDDIYNATNNYPSLQQTLNISKVSNGSEGNPLIEIKDNKFSLYEFERSKLVDDYTTKLDSYNLLRTAYQITHDPLKPRSNDHIIMIDYKMYSLNLKIIKWKFNIILSNYDIFHREMKTVSSNNKNNSSELEKAQKDFILQKLRDFEIGLKNIREYSKTITDEIEYFYSDSYDKEEEALVETKKHKLDKIMKDVQEWFRPKRLFIYSKSHQSSMKNLFDILADAFGLQIEENQDFTHEYYQNSLEDIAQRYRENENSFLKDLIRDELFNLELSNNISMSRKVSSHNVDVYYEVRKELLLIYDGIADQQLKEYESKMTAYENFTLVSTEINNNSNDNASVQLRLNSLNLKIIKSRVSATRAIFEITDPRFIKTIEPVKGQRQLSTSSKEIVEKNLLELEIRHEVINDSASKIYHEIRNLTTERMESMGSNINLEKKLNEILLEERTWYTKIRKMMELKLEPASIQSLYVFIAIPLGINIPNEDLKPEYLQEKLQSIEDQIDANFSSTSAQSNNFVNEYDNQLSSYNLLRKLYGKLNAQPISEIILIDYELRYLKLQIIKWKLNVTAEILNLTKDHDSSVSEKLSETFILQKLRDLEKGLKSIRENGEIINDKIINFDDLESEKEERDLVNKHKNKLDTILKDVHEWYRPKRLLIYSKTKNTSMKNLHIIMSEAFGLSIQDNHNFTSNYYRDELKEIIHRYMRSENYFLRELVYQLSNQQLVTKISLSQRVSLEEMEDYYEFKKEIIQIFNSEGNGQLDYYKSLLSSFEKFRLISIELNGESNTDTLLVKLLISKLEFDILNYKFNGTKGIDEVTDPRIIKIQSSKNHDELELSDSSKEIVEKHIRDLEIGHHAINDSASIIYHEIQNLKTKQPKGTEENTIIYLENKLNDILLEELTWSTKIHQMIKLKLKPATIKSVFIFTAIPNDVTIPSEDFSPEYFQEKLLYIKPQIVQLDINYSLVLEKLEVDIKRQVSNISNNSEIPDENLNRLMEIRDSNHSSYTVIRKNLVDQFDTHLNSYKWLRVICNKFNQDTNRILLIDVLSHFLSQKIIKFKHHVIETIYDITNIHQLKNGNFSGQTNSSTENMLQTLRDFEHELMSIKEYSQTIYQEIENSMNHTQEGEVKKRLNSQKTTVSKRTKYATTWYKSRRLFIYSKFESSSMKGLIEIVAECFNVTAQEVIQPKNFQENLEFTAEEIMECDRKYEQELANDELWYQKRLAGSSSGSDHRTPEDLEFILEERDEDFEYYKTQRKELVDKYLSNLVSYDKIRNVMDAVTDGPINITLFINYQVNLLKLEIMNYNYSIIEIINQIADPRIVTKKASLQNNEKYELDKSGKLFVEKKLKKLKKLDNEFEKIREFGE